MIIMIISGELEKAHMALMTAAAVAAMGKTVGIFISKSATKLFTRDGWRQAGGEAYDLALSEKGLADFGVLLDALRSLNARFIICDASLVEHGLDAGEITADIRPEIAGLATLVEMSEGAHWLTF